MTALKATGTVEGAKVAMTAAEEAAAAVVEQADDRQGGRGALLLSFIVTGDKRRLSSPDQVALSPAVSEQAPNWIIEWLYLVQCNKFIALCRAMSGPPSGHKIVCAVVALPGAKHSLHIP